MALSYVTYTGDNSTTNFTFDKGYIQQSDVAVYLDGVLQTLTTHYTWFNDTTIQFLSPPALDVVVLIERSTENTSRLVDFQDAANLTEADLDLNSDQMFYLSQESQDDFTDNAMTRDTDNKWDADSKVIKNVTDPTNDQDAATKAYGDANWGGTAAAAAAASAAAAATSETNAAASESNASTSEANAATSEANAAASYDSFDDRYLGAKASDPATDNDGDALTAGVLYYNTTDDVFRVHNGSSWQDVLISSLMDYVYTASASQTSFTGADDNTNTLTFTDSSNVFGVYQNGVRLIEGAGNDYTIGSNTITLTSGAALDDIVVIQTITGFTVADAITQTTADARYLKKTDDLSDMYTPTKGNLLVGNGTAFVEVGIGTDGYLLEADSTDAEGLAWVSPFPKWENVAVASVGSGNTYTSSALSGTVEQIHIGFEGLSLSGTDEPVLCLATGGTPTLVRTGYACTAQSSGNAIENYTTGFVLTSRASAATDTYYGSLTLRHVGSNIWSVNGGVRNGAVNEGQEIAGYVSLGAALTGIGFGTESAAGTSGSDLLDGGNVSFSYLRSA
jgi:hypothetical protein